MPVGDIRPFPLTRPPQYVYRVAEGTNPLALRKRGKTEDHPPAGRWDDADGHFGVLYTSGSEVGALHETLQRFRPANDMLTALRLLEVEEEDAGAIASLGIVPLSWLSTHTISKIEVISGDVVPMTSRGALGAIADRSHQYWNVGDMLGENGFASRAASRMAWLRSDVAGIEAPSKLGSDLLNYMFFEDRIDSGIFRARLSVVEARQLTHDDLVLVDVVNSLGLRIAGAEAVREDPREIWVDALVRHVEEREPDAAIHRGATERGARAGSQLCIITGRGWSLVVLRPPVGRAMDVVVINGDGIAMHNVGADAPVDEFVERVRARPRNSAVHKNG